MGIPDRHRIYRDRLLKLPHRPRHALAQWLVGVEPQWPHREGCPCDPGRRSNVPSGTSVAEVLKSEELRAVWLRNRIFIGKQDAMPPSISFGTDIPTSGIYARGSVVFNQNAEAGQPMGCQYDGTCWRQMANL